eukprot:TRINITY_DN10948_c0_g1_i1.p1 TRINITY_DN10948_c0_g1~~TRINITY_DN10948_c0_g1_i1.p1  ORF type:complete len:432 (+),score=97.46 TRINITY_DN10948_c0_g1_i1:633-1928(+)
MFWSTGKFFARVGAALEYYDTNVGVWTESTPPGSLIRVISWSVKLREKIGPSSTTLTQTQWVKLKSERHMEIELSSSSEGIPFAKDFNIEERWSIIEREDSSRESPSCQVKVFSEVNWKKVSFGASFIKGTIDDKSLTTSAQNCATFLDQCEAVIKERVNSSSNRSVSPTPSNTANGKSSPHVGRHKNKKKSKTAPPRAGTVEGKKKRRRRSSNSSTTSATSTTSTTPSLPSSSPILSRTSRSIPPTPSPTVPMAPLHANKYPSSPQDLLLPEFQYVVMSILAILVVLMVIALGFMFARISSLEASSNEASQLRERVSFLSHVVNDLHKERSDGDVPLVDRLKEWKMSEKIGAQLKEWDSEIDSFLEHIERIDIPLPTTPPPTLLMTPDVSWLSYFLSWTYLLVSWTIWFAICGLALQSALSYASETFFEV